MQRLSINAVAVRLGVSAAALYRHVESRWQLERLVGASLIAELELCDDPTAVAVMPPGRPIGEAVAELDAAGGDR